MIWYSPPLLWMLMFSPGTGFSITRTGEAPPLTVGAVAAGALLDTLTLTCLYHQPLPGVCGYTDNAWPPADNAPAGTTAAKPEAAQKGLAVAAATSGRFCAKVALASILPPPSIVPCQICMSSAPAQPSAVLSTNQPATVNPPVGTVAFIDGTS